MKHTNRRNNTVPVYLAACADTKSNFVRVSAIDPARRARDASHTAQSVGGLGYLFK